MSFWAIFVLWPSKQPKKWKFQKNEKKPGDIIILLKCTKIMMIGYTIPKIWRVTDVIVIFHFGLFLPFYSLNSPKNQNFKKKKRKKCLEIRHFTHLHRKLWLDGVPFLRYGAWQTDGQTDGRKKWHIEEGAPPENESNWLCRKV